jgi:prepilin-type N-terminal cleavage/methylation domain-containing protein
MQKNTKKGFTLIELLVVIAIIALLLAILMPALKKVRERAKQTVCKTSLRGIGLAIKLYTDDYDDRTPESFGNRYGWLNPTTGRELEPGDPGIGDSYWGLRFNDYSKNPKIFSCPSFAQMKSTIYTVDEDNDILGGFGVNRWFENIKVTSIRSPAEYIIAQDHAEPHPEENDLFYINSGSFNLDHYRTGGRIAQYRTIFRHAKKSSALDNPPGDATRRGNILGNPNGQSNTLYMDGSVDAMDETTGENVRESWYSGR